MVASIKLLLGVMYQIVYRALEGLLDLDEVSKESSEKQDRTPLQSFLALISGIFTPILPVITAAGMIKAVLSPFWLSLR